MLDDFLLLVPSSDGRARLVKLEKAFDRLVRTLGWRIKDCKSTHATQRLVFLGPGSE